MFWRQKWGIMANTLTLSELRTSCVAKITIFPFSNKIHQVISRIFSSGKKIYFHIKFGLKHLYSGYEGLERIIQIWWIQSETKSVTCITLLQGLLTLGRPQRRNFVWVMQKKSLSKIQGTKMLKMFSFVSWKGNFDRRLRWWR